MALVEITRGESNRSRKSVTSYDGADAEKREWSQERRRTRLTPDEARTVNYVLCGWDSEIGLASNFGSMIASIADRTLTAESKADVRRRGRELAASRKLRTTPDGAAGSAPYDGVTACAHATVHTFDVEEMGPVERWANDRSGVGHMRREKVLRAWRALVSLGRARSPSAVVLIALFGDLPPGLPTAGLFPKAVDPEYRRVVRYVDASGGSGLALERKLQVDRRRRPGEDERAHTARVVDADVQRRCAIAEIGAACEKLIEAAATDYRAALRGVS